MKAKRTSESASGNEGRRILIGEEALRAIDEEFAALQRVIAARAKEAGLTEEDVAKEIEAFRRGE